VRRSVYEQRIRRWSLLYALGSALWTGVVVVVLVQVFPETERRQFKQALDALPAAAGSCERGDAAWISSSKAAA
jgi:hypothetical protein